MNWGSAQAFFEMGGYALYVWGSYGVTALVIAGEVLGLRRRLMQARWQARQVQLLSNESK